MGDPLELLRVKGNARVGADDRHYVSLRFRTEDDSSVWGMSRPGVAPLSDPEIESAVLDWCKNNCTGKAERFGNMTMVFEELEDSILFVLRLRR